MNCRQVRYTGHALRRMFERHLTPAEVGQVLLTGLTIEEYPTDQPFPSRLICGRAGTKVIHVVVAHEQTTDTCHIITVYLPDPGLREPDWQTRRTP